METTFIYGLVDPRTEEIKYIGKSNKPSKRLREHISESKNKNGCGTKKENWIYKLYKLNLEPHIKILDEVKLEEYEYWEEFYIKKHTNLLNYDEKGIGAIFDMKKLTKKSKKVTSKKVYQYSLEGVLIKEYNSTRDAERKTGVNHGNISKVCNGAWNHAGGFIFSYEKNICVNIIKNPNATKKKIIEIDISGNIIEEFSSISEASKKTKIDAGNISKVCSGKLKSAKKRFFKFKN